MSVGIAGLPGCPRCDATIETLVHTTPGIAAAKPCGCVFAPGEFFGDELLEADHQEALLTDSDESGVSPEHGRRDPGGESL